MNIAMNVERLEALANELEMDVENLEALNPEVTLQIDDDDMRTLVVTLSDGRELIMPPPNDVDWTEPEESD